MRIIITQAEIELAIREHVLGQLSIKEGQQITVAFKNTRGDDGATAEIDITTPGTKSNVAEKPSSGLDTSTAIFQRREPAAVAAETVQEEPATEVAPEPSQTSPAPAAEAGSMSATEVVSSAELASTTSAQTTSSEPVAGNIEIGEDIPRTVPFDANQPVDQEVVTEAPKPQVKSLFANLTPPINKKS